MVVCRFKIFAGALWPAREATILAPGGLATAMQQEHFANAAEQAAKWLISLITKT